MFLRSMRLMCALLGLSLAVACGGEDGNGPGAGGGNGDSGSNGGDNCGGGAFDLSWSGGESGQATGDCVVTVVSRGSPPVVPPEFNVSALQETGDEVALILRINADTLAPIQAIFSLREDVVCNESDVLMMGNFDGAVNFTQRDADGFELTLGANLSCFDDSDNNPVDDFSIQLSGTISGSRQLML